MGETRKSDEHKIIVMRQRMGQNRKEVLWYARPRNRQLCLYHLVSAAVTYCTRDHSEQADVRHSRAGMQRESASMQRESASMQ